MPSPFVIVWDLDHTLGSFDSLEGARPTEEVTVELRPGIGEVLARLGREGFHHTVLTMATPTYAELALRGTGLRDHFIEVAGAGQRNKGDVEGIAQLLDMPLSECQHRMLFVGDHPLLDAPRGGEVVFHVELDALSRSAEDLLALVLALRESGAGSLARGFEALAQQGEPVDGMRRLALEGVGRLLLVPSGDHAPMVAFEEAGRHLATPVTFEPWAVSW